MLITEFINKLIEQRNAFDPELSDKEIVEIMCSMDWDKDFDTYEELEAKKEQERLKDKNNWTRTDIKNRIEQLNSHIEKMKQLRRGHDGGSASYYFCDISVNSAVEEKKELEALKKRKFGRSKKSFESFEEQIKKAKEYPIDKIINVGRGGNIKCLWHDDSSPSMKYNRQKNFLYCFAGCGKKDSIDLAMLVHNKSFAEVVKMLQ